MDDMTPLLQLAVVQSVASLVGAAKQCHPTRDDIDTTTTQLAVVQSVHP